MGAAFTKILAGGIAGLGVLGVARADVVYSNTFQSGTAPGPEWSSNAHFDTATPFTRFLGRYGTTDSVTLTLPRPPGDSEGQGGAGTYRLYNVTFDFFAIDTWDGYEPTYGPDSFQVFVNNAMLFNETFANQHNLQSYHPPTVGPTPLAYGVANDSIYRDISIDFTLAPTATDIQIRFHSQLSQTMADESWGIDNVRVGYSVVPSPGSLALLVLGGAMASRRRR
jgi:hypothetical protein